MADHRCIRGIIWKLNDDEGAAFIRVPCYVGDPEPEYNPGCLDDWSQGYAFCPKCGTPVDSPEEHQEWMDE
jgi:hypothetical protein